MKITFNTIWSPFTLDTYSTFTLDIEEQEIENYNDQNNTDYNYDDFVWTYDMDKYKNALADALIDYLNDNLKDDILLSFKRDGKVYSPTYYNYTTDNTDIEIEHSDKLYKWIEEREQEYINYCNNKSYYIEDAMTDIEEMIYFYLEYLNTEKKKTDSVDFEFEWYVYAKEHVYDYEYVTFELEKKSI